MTNSRTLARPATSQARLVTRFVALLALVTAACGPNYNAAYSPQPITGKVIRKDGQPLPGEMVIALVTSEGTPQVRAEGLVKPDGTIHGLNFIGIGGDGRPGMIPGKHYVELNRLQKVGDDALPPNPALDKLWHDFLQSIPKPLMIEVVPGSNALQIEL